MRPEEADLAHRLQRLVVRLSRELRWESAEIGVSVADALVLIDLRRHPGSGVSDLARMGGVARSVISERLKRLEADGLVERDGVVRPDRRRIGFLITTGGDVVLQQIARLRRNQVAVRLAALTPAERQAIAAALDALDQLPRWRGRADLLRDAAREAGHEAQVEPVT